MKYLTKTRWTTGSDADADFYYILKVLKEYTIKGSKIFIGTDSFISNNKICFASAICLYGGEMPGRYFFTKEKVEKLDFPVLVSRITEETRRSIEIACLLVDEYNFNSSNIEVHLDISPFSAGNGTSKFSDMLRGYVQGYGLDYKLKPDAWASQSIADRHSK
jgi:predicted RNase H-related nuclease YkuK (DUF458 family)